jgi:hypothetical protein
MAVLDLPINQQAEIWIQWKKGDSLSDIGRALRKHPGSVHHLIAFNGVLVPLLKKRAQSNLTLKEREEIYGLLLVALTG